MKTYNIFLTSPSDLREDREQFEIFINRKNDEWLKKGVHLKIVVWENFLNSMSDEELQSEYRKAIKECDIFVMLISTKIGKYTEEVFENVFKEFKETNKPKIYTYFKNVVKSIDEIKQDEIESLWAFQMKLEDLKHPRPIYNNPDMFILHFSEQLDKLVKSGFFKFDETKKSLKKDKLLDIISEKNSLIKILKEIQQYENPVKLHPDFLFRGQSDSNWGLEPSLTRILVKKKLPLEKCLQLEREMVNKFSISASNLLDIKQTINLSLSKFSNQTKGIDFIGWFVVMQHYYAPTRCLDWSSSAIVAAYFACQDENSDGAIWIADYKKITDHSNKKINKRDFATLLFDKNNTENIVAFMHAFNTNERIETQQGFFSICSNMLLDHRGEMETSNALYKIIIPKNSKLKILSELYTLNINAKTLFPGIDGLGKSIKEFCNLWVSVTPYPH